MIDKRVDYFVNGLSQEENTPCEDQESSDDNTPLIQLLRNMCSGTNNKNKWNPSPEEASYLSVCGNIDLDRTLLEKQT